jgi:hypothetical protein
MYKADTCTHLFCTHCVHTGEICRGDVCVHDVCRYPMSPNSLQTVAAPCRGCDPPEHTELYIVLYMCTLHTHICCQYTRVLCTMNSHIRYVEMCTKHVHIETHAETLCPHWGVPGHVSAHTGLAAASTYGPYSTHVHTSSGCYMRCTDIPCANAL